MSVENWAILVAIGVAQGAFLTVILALRRDTPSRWLAALVAVFTLALVEEFVDLSWTHGRPGFLIGLTLNMELVVGPILLFYVRSLVTPDRVSRRLDLLHLVPFVASAAWFAPFYFAPVTEKLMLLNNPNPALVRFYALKALVLSLYLIMTLVTLPCRADDHPVIRWTRRCLVALVGLGVLTLGLSIAGRHGLSLPVDSDRATASAVTVGLYGLALAFLRAKSGKGLAAAVVRSYRTSPLDYPAKAVIADRVLSYWEARRPHQDSELTLESLVQGLAVPAHHLSQVFNEHLGQGFYGFVNGRRVADLKALLADASRDGDTVLRLGLEAGFNSKASLNRAFRQVTGTTPSEFRRQAQEARSGGGTSQSLD